MASQLRVLYEVPDKELEDSEELYTSIVSETDGCTRQHVAEKSTADTRIFNTDTPVSRTESWMTSMCNVYSEIDPGTGSEGNDMLYSNMLA